MILHSGFFDFPASVFLGECFFPGLRFAGHTFPVLVACCRACICIKNSFTF